MKLSRALLISLIVTLAATLLLSRLVGGKALFLFLLLPLGFLFSRKNERENSPRKPAEPIEPR